MGTPTHADYFMLSLCLWREAVSDGPEGMAAVGWVVRNRVTRRDSSFYTEVVRRLQFSSITDPKDGQLTKYPSEFDADWKVAQSIAEGVILETIADPTNGSTMYYSPRALTQGNVAADMYDFDGSGKKMVFPKGWNYAAVKYQKTIGVQLFFTEV